MCIDRNRKEIKELNINEENRRILQLKYYNMHEHMCIEKKKEFITNIK